MSDTPDIYQLAEGENMYTYFRDNPEAAKVKLQNGQNRNRPAEDKLQAELAKLETPEIAPLENTPGVNSENKPEETQPAPQDPSLEKENKQLKEALRSKDQLIKKLEDQLKQRSDSGNIVNSSLAVLEAIAPHRLEIMTRLAAGWLGGQIAGRTGINNAGYVDGIIRDISVIADKLITVNTPPEENA